MQVRSQHFMSNGLGIGRFMISAQRIGIVFFRINVCTGKMFVFNTNENHGLNISIKTNK